MKIVRSSSRTCSARFAPGQNQLLANLSLLLFFKDLSIVRFYDFKKNFRGMCFTVQLSKIVLHCRLSQTALLLYHVVSCLSRTFFNFFEVVLLLSCSNFDILSHPTGCCQELFFISFFIALCQTQLAYVITSLFRCQELFFISFHQRRRRDLNPRTAQTVYTLSRGTSSAT